MTLEEFKKATKKEIEEYGKTLPLDSIYDENGNELTYKDSDGYWSEYTYDENGNILTYKYSDGYWTQHTYDKDGNVLTFKNSDGKFIEY